MNEAERKIWKDGITFGGFFGLFFGVLCTGIAAVFYWAPLLHQAKESRDRCWRESAALECDDHPEVCVGKERADLAGVFHSHLPKHMDHAPQYFPPFDAGPMMHAP